MLSARQEKILFSLIEVYTRTAEPVSSKLINDQYFAELSSATIRADMYLLETEDYLYQPHTSSGRIPTDKAYRHYVNKLQNNYFVPSLAKDDLAKGYSQSRGELSCALQKTARFLADMLDGLSLVTDPLSQNIYSSGMTSLIENPEFNDVDKIKNLLFLLEEKEILIQKLKQELQNHLFVLQIGKENNYPELKDCSLAATCYKINQKPVGIVSIITSKRANYAKLEPTLNQVAENLDQVFGRRLIDS